MLVVFCLLSDGHVVDVALVVVVVCAVGNVLTELFTCRVQRPTRCCLALLQFTEHSEAAAQCRHDGLATGATVLVRYSFVTGSRVAMGGQTPGALTRAALYSTLFEPNY